jgi:hypothetical protein
VRCVLFEWGVKGGEDAVCCSVVQGVAVCCRVVQCVAGGVGGGEDADPPGDRECCNSFSRCCSWF